MDINETIKFLDPETTAEAISEVEYYGGFNGREKAIQKINEACEVAVAVMKGYQYICEKLDRITSASAENKSDRDKILKDCILTKEIVSERLSNISELYKKSERETEESLEI